MDMLIKIAVTFTLALSLCGQSLAQFDNVEYDWELKRDREGIEIFTSKVPDSAFNAVRSEMIIEGTVSEFVALVNDLPRCADWADLCKFSKAIKVVSPREQYVHIHNKVPFPVKDRDVVAHVLWKTNTTDGSVSMYSEAVPEERSEEFVPSTNKAVRIYKAATQWHFTPLENGNVKVENFAHIDPNGPTPAWVTNLLLVSSPFKTMQGMREEIRSGFYRDVSLPF